MVQVLQDSRGCQKVNHDFCKVRSKFNVALTVKHRLAHNLLEDWNFPGPKMEPGNFQGPFCAGRVNEDYM